MGPLDLVEDAAAATDVSPDIPKMVIIGEQLSYETVNG